VNHLDVGVFRLELRDELVHRFDARVKAVLPVLDLDGFVSGRRFGGGRLRNRCGGAAASPAAGASAAASPPASHRRRHQHGKAMAMSMAPESQIRYVAFSLLASNCCVKTSSGLVETKL
jgi:hypothetical protein